ncbi:hypothetical protein WDJ50_13170 [Deinococcus sp. VB142]|uniref:Uncharacterized protein n=1 Tax=Deinococcus sp. VB142 TaxID=3112952 RepID=A0AAU6Q240_9DEIO
MELLLGILLLVLLLAARPGLPRPRIQRVRVVARPSRSERR